MSDSHHEDRLQRVREIAYDLWEKEGNPEGRDHEFWLRAESLADAETSHHTPAEAFSSAQERKVDEDSENSFPASDPPSFTPSKAGGTNGKAA
ncbi:MAG: DUF2934 domain-containing protein [Proteobacteria bacterium]|nr:DUF2934 domain-containing protein [Pseudomonadota bacterium]